MARLSKGPGSWVASQQRPSLPSQHIEPALCQYQAEPKARDSLQQRDTVQMGWGVQASANVGGLGNTGRALTCLLQSF